MLRMLKICALALAMLLAAASGAWAEELPEYVKMAIPAQAVVEQDEAAGSLRMITLSIPETGERLLLTCDERIGRTLFVETEQEAACDPGAAPVERSRAEELVRLAYPDCRILFAEETDSGKRLGVVGESFCGTITVADDQIRSRSLQMGEIYSEGRLTMSGALQALKLHRPEAEFRALELEEDDGAYIYEGEALISGETYEFELDVITGKLLEWERD